ncbi:MAG: DoxX family protein [Longimicrobiales bacterium]
MFEASERYRPIVQGIMRIVVAFLYWSHGAQKLMGWFGGFGPDGGTADLGTIFGAAGIIEFFGGLLLILGLLTQPVAFLVSGEMAVAYFTQHMPNGGFWPWDNRGEVVAAFCFVFLFFAFAGAGAFSLDGLLRRRRQKVQG